MNRDGRVRAFTRDSAGHVLTETWYENVADADAAQNADNVMHYAYDAAGRLTAESDGSAAYAYAYDSAGRLVTVTASSAGQPAVVLTTGYDGSSNQRNSLAATIDGLADFRTSYHRDAYGLIDEIHQTGQTDGNAVADKRVHFGHSGNGQLLSIERYQSDQLVAASDYAYDTLGRISSLVHSQGAGQLASYGLTYAAARRAGSSGAANTAYGMPSADEINWMPSPGVNTQGVVQSLIEQARSGQVRLAGVTSIDGTANYRYDPTGQLIAATYSSPDPQSPIPNPESYTYDANGNRINSGYVIGVGNRLLSDGTYTYCYDSEGNRTGKFIDADLDCVLDAGDTDVTQYAWDNRNRLREVANRATAGGAATHVVDYLYDMENRWIGEDIDSNGDAIVDHQTRFVYDGNQIALQFDKDGAGDVTAADVSHRYLWGPAVDQLLADERTHLDGSGNVATQELLWALADQLGSVRDLARSDGTITSVVDHIIYDSFGKVTSENDPSEGSRIGFTGRPTSEATGLRNHVNRWTDPRTADWMSEDPARFSGRDTNLYRYVSNSPTNGIDPAGLWKPYVHVLISITAADRAQFHMKNPWKWVSWGPLFDPVGPSSFAEGLEAGSKWPDNTLPHGVTLYQSHLGKFVYWHSMATRDPATGQFYTPLKMQEKIVAWIIEHYEKALAASSTNRDRDTGWEIGVALHALQDSYTPSHVVRANGTGQILQFQDYNAQDSAKHAIDDVPHDSFGNFPSTKPSFFAALDASRQLLQYLKDRTSSDVVETWLLGPGGPLDMAPNATVGGTAPRYAPPPPMTWNPFPMP